MPSPEGSPVPFRRVPEGLARRSIERFARTLQHEIAKDRGFDCLITGDAELRRLNREFRGKDYAADVLSFPAAAGPWLGDVAISLGRAPAQARQFGHSIEPERQLLRLHAVLRLLKL